MLMDAAMVVRVSLPKTLSNDIPINPEATLEGVRAELEPAFLTWRHGQECLPPLVEWRRWDGRRADYNSARNSTPITRGSLTNAVRLLKSMAPVIARLSVRLRANRAISRLP